MRYKVVKKTHIYDDKPIYDYYVMYERKVWWKKELVWRYCKEHTYASSDTWLGVPVKRKTLLEAENYIKLQIRINSGEFNTEDIKIYECRDSKLEKILNPSNEPIN